jgi:hypothetical protein
METSISLLSELRRSKRLDPDRYHHEYIQLEERLRTVPNKRRLSALVREPIRTGRTPRERDVYGQEARVRFIKTDSLREGFIDIDECPYLPARVLSQGDYLDAEDVLVTIIGADRNVVGRAAVVLPQHLQSTTNQNVAVIRPDRNLLNPFYLSVFLNSTYGRQQIWMLSRQTEQVNLNCPEVGEVLVPLVGAQLQGAVEEAVRGSSRLMELSKSTYSEAQGLVLDALGLSGYEPSAERTYTATLVSVSDAHRMNAEYFHPKYRHILDHLGELRTKSLGSLLRRHRKGIEVGSSSYEETGARFIRVGNVSVNGLVERDQKRISGQLYQTLRGDYEPVLGDLLVTKDATPGIAYVVKEPLGGIISSGILRLDVDDREVNREYLALYLNSVVGQMQVDRGTTGSVILHWKLEEAMRLLVAKVDSSLQRQAEGLVQRSHALRVRALAVLRESLVGVDRAIEGTWA